MNITYPLRLSYFIAIISLFFSNTIMLLGAQKPGEHNPYKVAKAPHPYERTETSSLSESDFPYNLKTITPRACDPYSLFNESDPRDSETKETICTRDTAKLGTILFDRQTINVPSDISFITHVAMIDTDTVAIACDARKKRGETVIMYYNLLTTNFLGSLVVNSETHDEVTTIVALPEARRQSRRHLLGFRGGLIRVGTLIKTPRLKKTKIMTELYKKGNCCSLAKLIALPLLGPGTFAVRNDSNQNIEIYTINKGKTVCTHTLNGHTNYVQGIATLPKERLASVDSGGTVKIWDISSMECASTINTGLPWIKCLAVLPSGFMILGDHHGTASVLSPSQKITCILKSSDGIHSITAFDKESFIIHYLAAGMKLYDLKGKIIGTIDGKNLIRNINTLSHGQNFATFTKDIATLWCARSSSTLTDSQSTCSSSSSSSSSSCSSSSSTTSHDYQAPSPFLDFTPLTISTTPVLSSSSSTSSSSSASALRSVLEMSR